MNKSTNIQTFGRRKCRKLSDYRVFLLDEILPKFEIKLNDDQLSYNIYDLFPNHDNSSAIKKTLEIGFGDGGHLFAQSKKKPDDVFIGCEPFINGAANLLKDIEEDDSFECNNLRIFCDDVFKLLEKSPNSTFDLVYVLFPDPWPKKKHNKRRIIQKRLLDLLVQKMSKDGKLVIATDHADYGEWILQELSNHDNFKFDMSKIFTEPCGWIKTKYQKKAEKQQSKIYYVECEIVNV